MGMALTSCTVPPAGEPTFQLGEDEMEIGIGIHGEPGRERMPLEPADKITERLATAVVDDLPYREGDQVLAFVNGMGGTPLLELYIVYRALNKFLDGRGITIARNLVGTYMTSLEMAGMSITLLRLDDELTAPVGRAGGHTGAALGVHDQPMSAGYEQRHGLGRRFAAEVGERKGELDAARPGDRRRRPRDEHGPWASQGGREAGHPRGR